MTGRDLKADAVRAGVPLYRLAAGARINPNRLSKLLNNRVPVDAAAQQRISEAIQRLADPAEAPR